MQINKIGGHKSDFTQFYDLWIRKDERYHNEGWDLENLGTLEGILEKS